MAGWGGYMDAKKRKLAQQFNDAEAGIVVKSKIFENIHIFVNGYTDPPASVLRHLMIEHGGEYHVYPSASVTHMIVSNLPYSKKIQVKPGERYVSAKWITDSIAAGHLLPVENYLLYGQTNNKKLENFNFNQNSNDAAQPELLAAGESSTSSKNQTMTSGDPNFIGESSKSSKNQTMTSGDPNFISEFYSRSRLHFIATLGQKMKDYVRNLIANSDGKFRGREILRDRFLGLKTNEKKTFEGRIFMHLDMDCFFVSVRIRDRPELQGNIPIAVTHSKGKGPKGPTGAGAPSGAGFSSYSEIASCSYEARKFGIKNGMFLGAALKLCPDLKTVDYDFVQYEQVSHELYDVVASYTLNIEAVSVDELYAEITEVCQYTKASPLDVASAIRKEIQESTKCPASAGMGPNMLVARLATKKAKPNGQYFVAPAEVSDFIGDFLVKDLM